MEYESRVAVTARPALRRAAGAFWMSERRAFPYLEVGGPVCIRGGAPRGAALARQHRRGARRIRERDALVAAARVRR